MISFRTISLPMFALAASLVACSAEQSTTAQPDTASTAQQASQADAPADDQGHGPRGFHHGPPGGPEFLIGAALHAPDLDLTDAQRATIEGLAHGDRPDHREHPPFDASKAKELAAAIRSGNVASLPAPPAFDATKLQAHLAEAAARIKTLHDTLSADQRAKLVADVQAHAPKGRPPGGPAMHMRGPHGDMLPFGQDLHLTDAQKQQLQAKFEANHPKADFAAIHAEMQARLESFKADNFDATAFVTPPAQFQPKMNGNPLADLVSVLTPEQRELLAKKIEAGPPARP
jgi:Spy/CpxP family protein refolding chaperone